MARIKIDLPQKCMATFLIPVRITDVNYGGHVGNDSIVSIIHEARVQFFQQYGFTEVDVCGTSLIMNELIIEFKKESFYKDKIEVKIFTGEIFKVGFELFYSLSVSRNEKHIIIANAKTGMICFNYNTRKIENVPEKLKELISV